MPGTSLHVTGPESIHKLECCLKMKELRPFKTVQISRDIQCTEQTRSAQNCMAMRVHGLLAPRCVWEPLTENTPLARNATALEESALFHETVATIVNSENPSPDIGLLARCLVNRDCYNRS